MTYHFVLTIDIGGGAKCTKDGPYTPKPGETRQQAYRAILADLRQDVAKAGRQLPAFTSTLFFSLEPDNLEIGGAR